MTCCADKKNASHDIVNRNRANFHYIGQSDRWSQNINLWTRFSSFWLFRLMNNRIAVAAAAKISTKLQYSVRERKENEMRFYWYWTRACTRKDPAKKYYVNYSTEIMIIPPTVRYIQISCFSSLARSLWDDFSYQTLWWWQKSIENIFSAT